MAGTLVITNKNFQAGTAIVASEMNTNFTEVENYINNSMPSLGTASVFTAAVTCNAGFTSTADTTALGVTTATTLTTAGASASSANLQVTFAEDYKIYADNIGSGSDNSRLWIDSPNNGEIVLGPRGSSEFAHQMRLRATSVKVEGTAFLADGQACINDSATPATIASRLLTLRSTTAGMVPSLAWAETAVSGTTPVAGIFMIGADGDGTNPDTNDYWLLFRKGNGDTIGSVRGDGTAGVAFETSSDQTLKNDLGVVTEASSVIDALQVHKFTWKDTDSKVGEHIGLFAQEAIEVLPYGIVSPASTLTEDGEEVYIPAGIDYSKIVPFLIAEIQSLRARVAAVEG